MIFTFKKINESTRVMFYATGISEANSELRLRYGKDADNYSLIAYVEAKRFSLTLN